jgi:signal recognition particle subunit SRP54
MFDSLSEKLQGTLANVRNRGTLSEQDVDAAMREIRLALLEADVNFKLAREFTSQLRERCLSAGVVGGLNPGQVVVKIVAEELTALMGGEAPELAFASRPPTVILMAGLQGSGKTTASAKLARYLHAEHDSTVAVAACDVYRPAAIEQLAKVATQAGATVYEQGTERDPVDVARWARERAERDGCDVLILDTSGRLHVDEAMMDELTRMRAAVRADHVLLVIDAMTGQEAAAVANAFADAVALDGIVITKLDGDARGGAALSVKAVTGKPILYASTGERLEQFERFHADRMAQRILGMGDVMTLIERAEQGFEQERAVELERKLRRNEFGLDDFLEQLAAIRRMGPLTSLLGMIPGLGASQLKGVSLPESELDRLEAIIRSMTPDERRRPELIKGSRRLRIARGSGTSVQEVSRLIKQFAQMRSVMRQVGRGKMPDLTELMRSAR